MAVDTTSMAKWARNCRETRKRLRYKFFTATPQQYFSYGHRAIFYQVRGWKACTRGWGIGIVIPCRAGSSLNAGWCERCGFTYRDPKLHLSMNHTPIWLWTTPLLLRLYHLFCHCCLLINCLSCYCCPSYHHCHYRLSCHHSLSRILRHYSASCVYIHTSLLY